MPAVYKIRIPFTGFSDNNLDKIAEWCWTQWGGVVPKDRQDGGIKGHCWEIYHTTLWPGGQCVTVGEFDSEDKATLFKLRWGNAGL